MYEQIDQIESDLIGRIAQLQYLNKSGSFQLSLRQRNTGGDSFNLFENVNAILKVDLKGYAAGRSVLPADLQHRYKLFERGVICTRLFSKNKSDIAVAQSIIASLVKDQPDHPAGTRAQGLPVEFRFASWLNLFDAFQLSSAPRDSDNLTMHDGRSMRFSRTSPRNCRIPWPAWTFIRRELMRTWSACTPLFISPPNSYTRPK